MADDPSRQWEGSDLPADCLLWLQDVDRIMKRDYCIDTSDAGADSEQIIRYWKSGHTAAEFVDWFGEKYDLITREQWDPFWVVRRPPQT